MTDDLYSILREDDGPLAVDDIEFIAIGDTCGRGEKRAPLPTTDAGVKGHR